MFINDDPFFSQVDDDKRPKKLPEIEANYDSDSSTEDVENTVGSIPMEWYDDFPHIGYDIDGKRVLRPAKGDELEKFLSTMDDPDSWRSVNVDKEGKEMVLNDEELDIIRRIQGGDIPDASYDPYEPTIEWFSSKKEVMPLSAAPEPKSRFVPSKWEAKKVEYNHIRSEYYESLTRS
jgi:ribosome biogenesis protein ERB1